MEIGDYLDVSWYEFLMRSTKFSPNKKNTSVFFPHKVQWVGLGSRCGLRLEPGIYYSSAFLQFLF